MNFLNVLLLKLCLYEREVYVRFYYFLGVRVKQFKVTQTPVIVN